MHTRARVLTEGTINRYNSWINTYTCTHSGGKFNFLRCDRWATPNAAAAANAVAKDLALQPHNIYM